MSNPRQPQTLRELHDLACPKCGQAEFLDIQITCMARLTTEGTEPMSDHEWDLAGMVCDV